MRGTQKGMIISRYQKYAVHVGVMSNNPMDITYRVNHRFIGVVDGWARFENVLSGQIVVVSEYNATHIMFED